MLYRGSTKRSQSECNSAIFMLQYCLLTQQVPLPFEVSICKVKTLTGESLRFGAAPRRCRAKAKPAIFGTSSGLRRQRPHALILISIIIRYHHAVLPCPRRTPRCRCGHHIWMRCPCICSLRRMKRSTAGVTTLPSACPSSITFQMPSNPSSLLCYVK